MISVHISQLDEYMHICITTDLLGADAAAEAASTECSRRSHFCRICINEFYLRLGYANTRGKYLSKISHDVVDSNGIA